MKDKRKLKLKKFYFHPITVFLMLMILVVILSAILSSFEMQGTYNTINQTTNELEPVLVTVENMLNFDGMKYIFSNAMRNFISFAPLGMLLLALIGLSVAQSTGFVESFGKRHFLSMKKQNLTFIVLFIATISSLINEVGYAFLIPLAAIFYLMNNRNPLLGIITAFCGVSFGYGVSIFVGSMEVGLIPYTAQAARLIDENAHVALTSNLFIIMAFSLLLSIAGTFIIEKFIAPKVGKYKEKDYFERTEELLLMDQETLEQNKIEKDKKEKRGLRFAYITGLIIIIAFIYMIIPGLPNSGMLLDMSEKTYLNQLFGSSSYFQDGFTYMMCLFFLGMGLAYGIGAKTVKNDKDIINGCKKTFQDLGELFILIFVASQFISVFRNTNIGTIITCWCANLIQNLSFSGIPLILLVIIMIAIANLFITTPTLKWSIFSPVVVPALMQANISPAFSQFLLRVGDSITNGITPLLAGFVIYIGYLNIYNQKKSKPITIRESIKMLMPYFLMISAAWILLVLGWYLIGLPIGPGVYPTL